MQDNSLKLKNIFFLILLSGIFGLAKSSWAACDWNTGADCYTIITCPAGEASDAVCRQPNYFTSDSVGWATYGAAPLPGGGTDAHAKADDVAILKAGPYNFTHGVLLGTGHASKLYGQGIGSTIITHNAGNGVPLITILPTSAGSFIRVTGIYFENAVYCPSCGANSYTPDIVTSGSTSFRIDDCTFHNGKNAVETQGRSNGVIDSNIFSDIDGSIRVGDDSDIKNVRPTTDAWGRPIAPGTNDGVFIEHNIFSTSNQIGCSSLNEYVYHNNGARSTIRYNTFTNSCATYVQDYFDAHGLAGCDRGTVLVEMYNNSFNAVYPIGDIIEFRGGSLIAHDNSFTQPGLPTFNFWNEQPHYNGDTAWPSQDQPNNSFMWNNKFSADGISWRGIGDIWCNSAFGATCESQFIRKDRDYFLHAPCGALDSADNYGNICTHGRETYGGSPGYSNDFCTDLHTALLPGAVGNTLYNAVVPCCTGKGTGTCDMTFLSSGDNAYYPYTPFTCPHPLTGYTGSCDPSIAGTAGYNITSTDSTPPAAPNGLNVN